MIWISSTFLKTGAGEKYDLLGQKEEFRVNSQFALGTGMIGEELSAESELGQQSVSLCDDSGNNSVFFHEAQGYSRALTTTPLDDLEGCSLCLLDK